jgi:cytochrome c oxidase assembly protein subunit 15
MAQSAPLIRFRRLALVTAVLAFGVVVLGAYVRLNAAGLGCPDWPGCYGHFTAAQAAANLKHIESLYSQPFEYAKAHKEMIHRYFAATLGLLILVLAILAWRNRRDPQQPLVLPLVLVGLVIFQGLLGMWTVTLLLKPLIVLLHLLGGLTTLALLAWLAMAPPEQRDTIELRRLKSLTVVALVMLGLQISLGGWTSTNYAALACPDFPTCQNSFWPQMDPREGFVLWRGLGINYEGGVLDHPARVAIHFVHRLGAVLAALILGYTAFTVWRQARSSSLQAAAAALALLLVAQLLLGPFMVVRGMPLDLATAHNAVAALLLLALVRVVRLVSVPAQRL